MQLAEMKKLYDEKQLTNQTRMFFQNQYNKLIAILEKIPDKEIREMFTNKPVNPEFWVTYNYKSNEAEVTFSRWVNMDENKVETYRIPCDGLKFSFCINLEDALIEFYPETYNGWGELYSHDNLGDTFQKALKEYKYEKYFAVELKFFEKNMA